MCSNLCPAILPTLLTSTYVAAAAKTRLVTGVTIEQLSEPSGP